MSIIEGGVLYRDSFVCRLVMSFYHGTAVGLRYSFLSRITEINEKHSTLILENGWLVRFLLAVHRYLNQKVLFFYRGGVIAKMMKVIAGDFSFRLLRAIGIILIFLILTRSFLFMFLLHKSIGLLDGIVRVLFIVLSVICVFSRVDREALMKSSILLNGINKCCKK